MTIMEGLTWANNKLKEESEIDAPMLDAQLLLAHVLDTSKSFLFTHFDQELTAKQLERFEHLAERRKRHEPIAYILGYKEFFGRSFFVNPFVLIPRPETEGLVEVSIREAKGDDVLCIDVGTGSGAIAVTLAAETNRPVIAIDTSTRALSVATQNANAHFVANKIQFLQGNLIEPIERQTVKPVHQVILCANLPYLTTRQWQQAPRDVKEYEPREALDGGVDGLEVYHALLSALAVRRTDFPNKLTLIIEIDPAQSHTAPALIQHFFSVSKPTILEDMSHCARLVIAEL